MEMGSELLLKPDGTFELALEYRAPDYSEEGKWRLEGENVILDSGRSAEEEWRQFGAAALQ
jgi:hypothetical protein